MIRKEECPTVFPFSSGRCDSRQVYSSSQSISLTSHDQFTRFILIPETEYTVTKSNGSQFRQIYSSFSFPLIHFQTPHENKQQMHSFQTEVISNWASLFINSFHQSHSSILTKRNRNWNSLHPILPFQSLPKKAHPQSHTRNSH